MIFEEDFGNIIETKGLAAQPGVLIWEISRRTKNE